MWKNKCFFIDIFVSVSNVSLKRVDSKIYSLVSEMQKATGGYCEFILGILSIFLYSSCCNRILHTYNTVMHRHSFVIRFETTCIARGRSGFLVNRGFRRSRCHEDIDIEFRGVSRIELETFSRVSRMPGSRRYDWRFPSRARTPKMCYLRFSHLVHATIILFPLMFDVISRDVLLSRKLTLFRRERDNDIFGIILI